MVAEEIDLLQTDPGCIQRLEYPMNVVDRVCSYFDHRKARHDRRLQRRQVDRRRLRQRDIDLVSEVPIRRADPSRGLSWGSEGRPEQVRPIHRGKEDLALI